MTTQTDKQDQPADAPADLAKALGATLNYVGKGWFDYLVEFDSEETVRNLNPDFTLLKMLPIRGLIVTSRATSPEFDFVSRFFAPRSGVDEDPVTGSAHCCSGPLSCAARRVLCARLPNWIERCGPSRFILHRTAAKSAKVRNVSG